MPPFTSNRRHVLAGLATASALAITQHPLRAHDLPKSEVFQHGVASGDPDATSVVLWTRVTASGQQSVEWELAEDQNFEEILAQGAVTTGPARDHTVKVLADQLSPGRIYYYRFQLGGLKSPIGRTRTLPVGKLDRLGITLASCSNFAFGYFNAYDAIASDASIDYVLHTGDYIYEYAADGWGSETAHRLGRVHEPAHEIVNLADYRQRHAQYKTDTGAQAMHAAHPLLACWDDHESTNNPWIGGAQNHQPETEGTWEARRAASIQAYFEWMPVREPEWLELPGRSRAQFWRSYKFGDLALLHTLETRHTARARQVDYADFAQMGEATQTAILDAVNAVDRPMLSPELESDLSHALAASLKAGQPWRLIGNPMPVARIFVPDVAALGLVSDADKSKAARVLAWKGRHNLPFYPDTWDGYAWARDRLYDLSRNAGASDLIFLTGDSHSFWANTLADKHDRPMGIELGTAGISSPGDFVESGFDAGTAAALDQAFANHNAEIEWTDNLHQGYVRLDLTPQKADANFIAVDNVRSQNYRTSLIKRFHLVREPGKVTLVTA